MIRVVSVKAMSDSKLEIAFSNGVSGIISIKGRLFGPVFEPLKDPQLFNQVRVDEFGAICWPNGADMAPDALYEKIRSAAPVAAQLLENWNRM
jgi:Protein of unknown function (DUF2442)